MVICQYITGFGYGFESHLSLGIFFKELYTVEPRLSGPLWQLQILSVWISETVIAIAFVCKLRTDINDIHMYCIITIYSVVFIKVLLILGGMVTVDRSNRMAVFHTYVGKPNRLIIGHTLYTCLNLFLGL